MRLQGKLWSASEIAARIDHTLLAPDATQADIELACDRGRKYGFNSVCVNPFWAPLVAEKLRGTSVKACSTIAFPLGNISTASKIAEGAEVWKKIAGHPCDMDFVSNISLLKDKQYDAYTRDMREFTDAMAQMGVNVKVILETGLLSDDEIRTACKCAVTAGVPCVKTSTGRAGPPSLDHIILMRANVPDSVKIKFSGFGTVNAPELALWGLLLGADLLGSPLGHLITDTLSGRYEQFAFDSPGCVSI